MSSQDVTSYHIPVLVQEVIEHLSPQPGGVYVDATFGGGGHSRAILEHEKNAQIIAFDWDMQAIELHQAAFEQEFPNRIRFVWGNFANIIHLLQKINVIRIDGVLADFGTSQYQIKHQPGFSVYRDTPLDMRMSSAHQRITASYIINKFHENELADLFWQYGEERFSRKIAQAIVEARSRKPITTTLQLAQLIERTIPRGTQRIHPATRVFQALRIYINRELENIKSFLAGALQVVKPDGRIVCISFHSLEDRIVKQFFKDHSCDEVPGLQVLTHRVITPSEAEIRANPAARSARLRAAQVCDQVV